MVYEILLVGLSIILIFCQINPKITFFHLSEIPFRRTANDESNYVKIY